MENPNPELVAAVWHILGGDKGALRLVRGELVVVEPQPLWRESEGVIYFSVTSDGTTGDGWIERLEAGGFRLKDYTKRILRSPDFKPTCGVTTEVAVLKHTLFEGKPTLGVVYEDAERRKLSTPSAELACLIREKFTDKALAAMDVMYILPMHEPIGFGEEKSFLGADRFEEGSWLYTFWNHPQGILRSKGGFAFVVSEKNMQSS